MRGIPGIIWAIVIISIGIGSCNPHPAISVKFIGELGSRKSYSSIQFMDVDEDSINRYIMEQRDSEPWIYATPDSLLLRLFQKAGYIKENRFLLSTFKADTAATSFYTTASGEKYVLHFYTDSVDYTTHFKLSGKHGKADVDTEAHQPQQLDYAFIDIIPGGNKELIFLDDYYIMNGDNYHFRVYEIIAP